MPDGVDLIWNYINYLAGKAVVSVSNVVIILLEDIVITAKKGIFAIRLNPSLIGRLANVS